MLLPLQCSELQWMYFVVRHLGLQALLAACHFIWEGGGKWPGYPAPPHQHTPCFVCLPGSDHRQRTMVASLSFFSSSVTGLNCKMYWSLRQECLHLLYLSLCSSDLHLATWFLPTRRPAVNSQLFETAFLMGSLDAVAAAGSGITLWELLLEKRSYTIRNENHGVLVSILCGFGQALWLPFSFLICYIDGITTLSTLMAYFKDPAN